MASQPLFVSSGDLIADQRYRWALDYAKRGDPAAAADILEQVVETAPGFATAWFALAVLRERMQDGNGAVAAFRAASAADPEDYHGARLHLARLGAGDATPGMTETYVRRLFDQHAPEFDAFLVGWLGYCGPLVLRETLQKALGEPLRFGRALDLGCGTGLAGEALRPFCDRLAGQDISPGMVEKAREKGIYDSLEVGDLAAFLHAQPAGGADLVLAADVFVYCSDLAPIAQAVAHALAPDGAFAFTVEALADGGVRLQDTLRYAHGEDHVQAALASAGLAPRLLERVSTRTEKGAPVPGLAVVAGRRPSQS